MRLHKKSTDRKYFACSHCHKKIIIQFLENVDAERVHHNFYLSKVLISLSTETIMTISRSSDYLSELDENTCDHIY